MGTASGCGTTTTSIVLPAKERHPAPRCGTGIHGGVTAGDRTYFERVRSRRCAQPPLPHHGYRIGVRHDDNIHRLTGENRYPWWGDSGETAPTSSGSVAEGAPSHPYPTMGTASGCGTTTTSIVLPAKAGTHGVVGGGGYARHVQLPTGRQRPIFITSCGFRKAIVILSVVEESTSAWQ